MCSHTMREMPPIILGISAYYHDSAVALLRGDEILYCAQEERFSRKKNDPAFPARALQAALLSTKLRLSDIDFLAYYENPWTKFDRLYQMWRYRAPTGFGAFFSGLTRWSSQNLYLHEQLIEEVSRVGWEGQRRLLGDGFRGEVYFVDHHASHAASAFYPSPFRDAGILTIDAVGEWASSSIGKGSDTTLELLAEQHFPHSVGMLYSAITYYLGFEVNEGEYKVMGLAPYGEPTYSKALRDNVVSIGDDGALTLDLSYFGFLNSDKIINSKLDSVLGGPPRQKDSRVERRHMDIAASVQDVCNEAVDRAARYTKKETNCANLVMAGGVSLNCVANGLLQRTGLFDQIWVQPAAGDAGGSLGAALYVSHQVLKQSRPAAGVDRQKGSLLGHAFRHFEIEAFLAGIGAVYEKIDDEAKLLQEVARLLDEQNIIGWHQGRMEFGPRALGSRSILADARPRDTQRRVNLSIKYRESFRPFAPVVLKEKLHDWFDVPEGVDDSPYMLFIHPVSERVRCDIKDAERSLLNSEDLNERLSVPRSQIPSVTHVDYTARIQTVDEERHGRLCRLLRAFESRTGCPVLVNTSFNVKGEPIVCSPEDALRCFLRTEIDVLVIEDYVLRKKDQPEEMIDLYRTYRRL